ncbi:type II toxin-antitoxin system RelE/ParE family toxin [Enterobacter sp.]|uniref:type II toxin-antitoxin system RelE/ParE family toxin n=1 Tax=Enterobacter sp. TaxID=42895 RepID=UPI003D0C65F3
MAIQSFACKDTQALFGGRRIPRWVRIESAALRKLAILNRVTVLEELRIPPGNRLEALARDRAGQHSIRVNDQWRICFTWTRNGPAGVEIVDYH